MATTNEILSEIASFTAAYGRPCPAKHLTDKFGADAADLIASLKKEGKVYGKRGRTGGLISSDAAPATNEIASAPADDDAGNDLAAEFAALAAKLAESSDDTQIAANG